MIHPDPLFASLLAVGIFMCWLGHLLYEGKASALGFFGFHVAAFSGMVLLIRFTLWLMGVI